MQVFRKIKFNEVLIAIFITGTLVAITTSSLIFAFTNHTILYRNGELYIGRLDP